MQRMTIAKNKCKDETPASYFQVFINNSRNDNASSSRSRSVQRKRMHNGKHITGDQCDERISKAKVVLFGEVDRKELEGVFDLQRVQFQLEGIEIVSDGPSRGVGKLPNKASQRKNESFKSSRINNNFSTTSSQTDQGFSRRNSHVNVTRHPQGQNSISSEERSMKGVNNIMDRPSERYSYFQQQMELLKQQTEKNGIRAVNGKKIFGHKNQRTVLWNQHQIMKQQKREFDGDHRGRKKAAVEEKLEEDRNQIMLEQIIQWTPGYELREAGFSMKDFDDDLMTRNSSTQMESQALENSSKRNVRKLSNKNEIIRTSQEIAEKDAETNLVVVNDEEKLGITVMHTEDTLDLNINSACTKKKMNISVPPMRLRSESSAAEVPLQFAPYKRKETKVNGSSVQSGSRLPILDPSPPWHCHLIRVRGHFNNETRCLEKELNEIESSSSDDCRKKFLECEILKRKRRAEILESLNIEHLRMLKSCPTAATFITARMEQEIYRFTSGLPIYNFRPDIKRILCKEARVLVVVADTGCGKSTQIPQYLVLDGIISEDKKVICTQPRKTAVYELMMRVAKETSLGSDFTIVESPNCEDAMNQVSKRLIFVTEKLLLDYLRQDRTLSTYGCVMIDEAHERTVRTDLCLGMMKEVLKTRPDMKLVICSATIDPEPFLTYFAEFGAQKLEISGRQFPVQIYYEPSLEDCNEIESFLRDYVNRTVEKVVEICKIEAMKEPFFDNGFWSDNLNTHAGHVLAFLSNPSETLAAEERLRIRLTELEHKVKVKIITLYGKMSAEDRVPVFAPMEPGYHHKVIFSTNVGETSITIPGVRYIVDCGLAKVKKFDTVRKTDYVELGFISKCAADQRTGRAGRTAPGICYRLYPKKIYDEMETANIPEIIVSNLCGTVLYMISAGIEDPLTFDFIDRPDSNRLLHSTALLRSLKAIECCDNVPVITRLGEQMKRLPVEPRLAKMVLDSINLDLVAETAVVAASINIGSPFLRGKEQSQFILADQKKLMFCEESGDPMTFLAVFWEYIQTPKMRIKQWSVENYVNLKCLKSVHDIARKICKIISEIYAGNTDIYSINVARAREHIPALFCGSFGNNLAVYSGIPQQGYFDFNEEKYFLIHPSSALKYSDVTPEFIVYECSVRTSANFLWNVCAADSNWLSGIDQQLLEEKRKAKLVTFNVCYGNTVKRWIAANMDNIRQEVGMECAKKKIFQDPYDRLQIIVAFKNLPKLEAFVKQIAKEKLDPICKLTREVAISCADYVLHLSGSGMPVEILMPGEFCSMFVGEQGTNWTSKTAGAYRDELENYFGKFGNITEFVTFGDDLQKKSNHACLIRMENKEVAGRAFTFNIENNCGFNIEPRLGRKLLGRVGSIHMCAYRLLITWWRRPSRGYGYVKLRSRNFNERLRAFDLIAKNLPQFQPSLLSENLMERDPSVTVEDLFKIALQALPLNFDNAKLGRKVRPLLDRHHIEYDDIYVVRKKAYPIDGRKTLQAYAEQIIEYILCVARNAGIALMPVLNNSDALREMESGMYPFKIKIRTPRRNTDIEFVAYVLFNDMNIALRMGNAVVTTMESGIFLKMGLYNQRHEANIQQVLYYEMEISKNVFNVIYENLKEIYDEIDHQGTHFGYSDVTPQNTLRLFITGEDFNAVNKVKTAVDMVIKGYTIICRDGVQIDGVRLPCHRLLSRVGRNFLRDLSRKHFAILNISSYKMEVQIQGTIVNIERVKKEIRLFLLEWLNAGIKQTVYLHPPDYQQGTLKELLMQNKYDLHQLEIRLGRRVQLDANITKRQLHFVGKENEYYQLLTILREISDSIKSRSGTVSEENEIPECVVCLCAVELKYHCLEACGHYICKSCMLMQLKASIEIREFPIACVTCEKPWTWFDLEVIVFDDSERGKSSDQLRLLTNSSLAYFIERHGKLYKHCATPDCRGLFPVTEDTAVGRCKLCGRLQCTRCGKEDHETLTCEEYEKLRVNADESLKKWIREDQETRQLCPNPDCQTPIEKWGGCNHMQCLRCKIHFCWLCSFTAKESKEIYAHMEIEHDGLGVDLGELIDEMEHDPFIREYIERYHPDVLMNDRLDFGFDDVEWMLDEAVATNIDHQLNVNGDGAPDLFDLDQVFDQMRDDEMGIEFEFRNDY